MSGLCGVVSRYFCDSKSQLIHKLFLNDHVGLLFKLLIIIALPSVGLDDVV